MGRSLFENFKEEILTWVGEGIITSDQAQKILERYAHSGVPPSGRRQLTATITTLGAMLVGVGVILFFASNWEYLPPWLKMGLLISAMLTSYGIGQYLFTAKSPYPRVAYAFFFLGSVLYGANIFLVAQIYNICEHWPMGVLAWGLGVLPMAFLLNSRSMGMLALSTLSFWLGSEIALRLEIPGGAEFVTFGILYAYWGLALMAVGTWLASRWPTQHLDGIFQGLGLFFVLAGLFPLTFKIDHSVEALSQPILWTPFIGKDFLLACATLASAVLLAVSARTYVMSSARSSRVLGIWMLGAAIWTWCAALCFPPGFLDTAIVSNIVYLGGIVGLLFIGYLESAPHCVNLGLMAFSVLVFARYFDFAYRYMERSWAFVLGGLILLLLGFSLERGRRKLLSRGHIA